MKSKNIVLKVDNQSFQETRYLNKIIGTIDLKNPSKQTDPNIFQIKDGKKYREFNIYNPEYICQ